MLGGHAVKFWSATWASIALSSGEAEYSGVVCGTGIGLGMQALLRDAGENLPLRVWTDSSAAMGTASHQGLGKLRHLECHSLWVQQRPRGREFSLHKMPGGHNPADLFIKHVENALKLDGLVRLFNCDCRDSRPQAAPQLKKALGLPQDNLFGHLATENIVAVQACSVLACHLAEGCGGQDCSPESARHCRHYEARAVNAGDEFTAT